MLGQDHVVVLRDVVCILLLSGLQKEDLDANTLAKLGRYNVNIDDMTNERHEECMLNPYTTKGINSNIQVTSEAALTKLPTEATRIPVTKKRAKQNSLGLNSKLNIRFAQNSKDNTDEIKINKTNGIHNTEQASYKMPPLIYHDLKNVSNVDEDNDLQIRFVENKPDVESVLDFWSKLTHHTRTVTTNLPTSPSTASVPNVNTENNFTASLHFETNNANLHAKEMELIGKLLAEYIGTENGPYTIEKNITKSEYAEYTPNSVQSNILNDSKNIVQSLKEQINEIRNLNNFTKEDRNVLFDSILNAAEGYPLKIMYNSSQRYKKTHETPHSRFPSSERKPIKTMRSNKSNPSQLFNSPLRLQENLENLASTMSYSETTIKAEEIKRRQYDGDNGKRFDGENRSRASHKVKDKSTRRYSKPDDEQDVSYRNEQPQYLNIVNNQKDHHKRKHKRQKNRDVQPKTFKSMLPSIKQKKHSKHTHSAMKRRVEIISDDNDYSESSGELVIERRQSGNADKKGQENYRYMNNELTMNNEIKKRDHSNQEHVTENSKVSHNRHYSNGSTIKKKQRNSDSLNEVKRAETPDATNREQQPAAGSHPVVRVRTIGDLQPISSKVIKEIAEKVKEFVLKDIEKGVTIRTVGTATTVQTSITEVSIQTSPTTTTTPFPQVTTTEKSSTTKNSEVNPVMLQLIEIFKELKNLKEPTTAPTTKALQDTNVSGVSASPTPILQKVPTLTATQKYPQQKYAPIYNPYSINSSPIHEQMINNAPYLPYITHLYNRPITLQTNDDQIAPLAIQISKPLKVMNQHVVITTQDPYIKMKQELERQSKKRVEDNFRIPHSDNNNRYGDRITYRNRFTKDRDKPRYYREHKEKVHHPVDSGVSGSLSHYSENVPYTGRLNRHEYNQGCKPTKRLG
ncbi:hypothetical protein HW555_012290 [Spodoptera exigua]|uniref:Uncharacterized protein n=1 Tax=Spodoptera exigua TaxID=7107 RepID=A0A835KZ70_SPOEX|nr:hypothetical protein HW555_012290 [Spodoptera exigua]